MAKSESINKFLSSITFKRFTFDFPTKSDAQKFSQKRKFKKKGYKVTVKKAKTYMPYHGKYVSSYQLTVVRPKKLKKRK